MDVVQQKLKVSVKFEPIVLAPCVMVGICIALALLIPDNERLKYVGEPYFAYAMAVVLMGFGVSALCSVFFVSYRERYVPKVKRYVVLLALITVANLITAKTSLLPLLYFPSFDDILSTYVQYYDTLLSCVTSSAWLYVQGVTYGSIVGIAIGVLIGWSPGANYWLFPAIRFIGPIPASVWVPLAVLVFPTLGGASAFIIALSTAFPVIVMTSSGIKNVARQYFEVGETLGASTLYQIVHIAIPAAMPQIFVGLFNGVTLAFMSLMVAELIGVQSGIGWYINWQQRVMSFADVYAALLLLALMCWLVLKVLFGVRDKLLGWQEGSIRW